MNLVVVSYSLTGNNRALAQSVAKKLQAKHIDITEKRVKKRTMGTCAKDLLFNLTPSTEPPADIISRDDSVLLVGPVWMGSVATPLRAYLKRIKQLGCPYAFLTISGGADGHNLKLQGELTRRVKRTPLAVLDLTIADLKFKGASPTRDDTSRYQITEEDIQVLTDLALPALDVLTGKGQVK
ncbi:MAG TPA: NAD(P)H-dependent oxidoreductase [Candidatus Limiplasma sp.]|nr:NAD(P)H-dependent oxidoreductase [Candidatus Limiplasma sp.]HRX07900.1 NAD(P)H-dependent oxidoreductase [Candidatus Limiplasma sp.]